MTECPRCKSEDSDVSKSWDVVPKSGRGKAMRITLYQCKTCGHKFRKASKIELAAPSAVLSSPTTETVMKVIPEPATENNEVQISSDVAEPILKPSMEQPTIQPLPMIPQTTTVHKESFFQRFKKAFTG